MILTLVILATIGVVFLMMGSFVPILDIARYDFNPRCVLAIITVLCAAGAPISMLWVLYARCP